MLGALVQGEQLVSDHITPGPFITATNHTELGMWSFAQTVKPEEAFSSSFTLEYFTDTFFQHSCFIPHDAYIERLENARRFSRLIIGGFLIVCGTLGNCLTLAVLHTKGKKWASSAVFTLKVLAIVDTLMLILGLEDWLRVLMNGDFYIRTLSAVACKVRLFTLVALTHMSSWTIVIVSIQRAIVVCFPMKANQVCTFKNTAKTWVFTGLFWTLWNCHVFETYGLYRVPMRRCREGYWERFEGVYCKYQDSNNHFGIPEEVINWVNFVTVSALPAVIICIANISIIWVITRPDFTLAKGISTSTEYTKAIAARRISMTKMLVTVSTSFLLTTFPSAIFYLRNSEWFGRTGSLSRREIAQFHFASEIVSLIFYVNNASNFLLYVSTGPHFRRAFWGMIATRRAVKSPTRESSPSVRTVLETSN